jgi:hypothetical protein
MARAPRAKVSKTSGQGVSRLSYQKGYALGNRGTSSGGVKDAPSVDNARTDPQRSGYAKGQSKLDSAGGINISYGDTIDPTNLVDVESLAKRKPPKDSGLLKPGKPFKIKARK